MNETTTMKRGSGGARDFLAVLFRRRWIIGSVFAVTTLTVVAINLSQPLFYESTGKVIVKRGVRDNMLQGYTRTLTWEEELASEVETVKSGAIVALAQASTTTASARPTASRRRRIDIRRVEAGVVGESNVIAMSYQDRDPEVAMQVTDAVIHAYMEYRKNEYTLKYPQGVLRHRDREGDEGARRVDAPQGGLHGPLRGQPGGRGRLRQGLRAQQEMGLVNVEKDVAQKRARPLEECGHLAAPGDSPTSPSWPATARATRR